VSLEFSRATCGDSYGAKGQNVSSIEHILCLIGSRSFARFIDARTTILVNAKYGEDRIAATALIWPQDCRTSIEHQHVDVLLGKQHKRRKQKDLNDRYLARTARQSLNNQSTADFEPV
ncbi:MAG: hypothetical protein ACI932_002822, partial [Paracoccaceae bacterium]